MTRADYIIEPILLKETKPMNTPLLFEQLTVFEMNGQDTRPFLKNQIISSLPDNGEVIYTSICNPKGRIQFSLFVFASSDGFFVAVNNDLSDNFFHYVSLRKFRMDFTIKKSEKWLGCESLNEPQIDSKHLKLATKKDDSQMTTKAQFWQFMFALELPWICQTTSELFIPQHVNLDQHNIIAFDKGCYPGQEIIARLHYIGKVKKRMRLLTTKESLDDTLGQSILLDDMDEKIEICSPSIKTENGWQVQAICTV